MRTTAHMTLAEFAAPADGPGNPPNSASEIEGKARGYPYNGAEAVWVINPKRQHLTPFYEDRPFKTIEILNREIAGDRLFPGFRLPLEALFDGI